MAFSRRAIAGAVVLLTACGSPTFTASGDGGDVDGGTTSEGGAIDAGPDAAPGPLVCPGAPNGGTCDAKSLCCIARSGGGNTFVGTCQTSGCPTSGGNPPVQLACTSSLQCPGVSSVCCIVKSNSGGGTVASKCSTAAACALNGAVLCEVGKATGCTAPLTCETQANGDWGLPPDLGTCGGVAPR